MRGLNERLLFNQLTAVLKCGAPLLGLAESMYYLFHVVRVQASHFHYFVSSIFPLFSFFCLLFRYDFRTSTLLPLPFVMGFYFHYYRKW